MKNLVSRNPVQRFKQGQKIQKFQQAGKIWKEGNRWFRKGPDDQFGKPIKFTNQYFNYGSFDGGKTYYNINSGKPLDSKSNQLLLNVINRRNTSNLTVKPESEQPKQETQTKKSGKSSLPFKEKVQRISSPIFYGTKVGGSVNRSALSNITYDQKSRLIGTGKFTEQDFANTKSLQMALNNYFANDGAGSIKEDNLWGNQTQKAFDLALSRAAAPAVATTKGLEIQKPVPIVSTYTPPTIPINQEVSNLNLNVPTYIAANRSQTRDWMRSNGINPYSVTGAMRAAARKIRAGQADDNDRLLVKGNEQLYNLLKGYYKQGGQLPSRNPVKRFKQRKKL